ncbi:rho GTPase-activating protein 5-like [Asparagus officinalis]|uniref:rho GTPase-activating protein 5-like n=1 Tax=Asparagus officinalis TaxID=4686 RepID=UPI00098E5B6D|nr:rho GTPase-activating protein 5-like [Asparagus officinalis]
MTGVVVVSNGCRGGKRVKREVERESQLSALALLMATLRKSMVHCRLNTADEAISAVDRMEIGWPTEVRHVAHVTFDRFHGFVGLPVEFEVEIPCKAPSASVSVFGVSAESMQCGYDSNGNSVPTILLLMQERLYSQGGLKAEGIFRITPENSEEKELRNQLNMGIIPDDIDVHCLAALIKAWFRELPEGILDSLSPGQVLQCESEEDYVDLVKLLPPTQFALLNWAVDLMADVVEEEEMNKMNPRNIAMVFAPNMTQLSDPLTSLMHAVQVMNLLQTLIFRTLRERDDAALLEGYSLFSSSISSEGDMDDENGELKDSSSYSFDDEVCCNLEEQTSDFQFSFNTSSVNEVIGGASTNDVVEVTENIEECFLKQLELGLKEVNGDQEREFSCPVSNPESSISTSEANQERRSAVINEVGSTDFEDIEEDKAVEMIVEALNLSTVKLSTAIEDDQEVKKVVKVLNCSSMNRSFSAENENNQEVKEATGALNLSRMSRSFSY